MNSPQGVFRLSLRRLASTLALALTLALPGAARADTTWNNTSTDFNAAGSWDTGVPDTADQALFPGVAAVNQPTLTADIAIGGLRFGAFATTGYIVDGPFTLSLAYVGATTATAALAGTHTTGTHSIGTGTILNFNAGTVETPANQYMVQNGAGTLALNGLITATAGTTLNFNVTSGVIAIAGTANTYASDTNIYGSGGVTAASIGAALSNSSLGAGTNVNLGNTTTGGILRYTGAGETVGKTIRLVGTTGGGTLENNGTGALTVSSFAITGLGTKTFTLGGTNTAISDFQGAISDNGGTTTFTKSGAGTWLLSGTGSSYTGNTNINGGILAVSSIGNAAANGSVGAGSIINLGSTTNAATLRYTGTGETTGKTINLNGTTATGTLEASGTTAGWVVNSLTFTGAGIKTLALTGDSAQVNTVAGNIVNNSGTNTTSVTKNGATSWVLSGSGNTYTGNTTIVAGFLGAGADNAMGTGTIIFNQVGTGTLFASGADRSLTNNIIIERPQSGGGGNSARFNGDFSLTINGNVTSSPNNQSGGITSRTIQNDIASNKFLTINGFYQTSATASTNSLTVSGTGNTIFNGGILDSSAATPRPQSLAYTGTGSLTLNAAGTYSSGTNFSGAGKVNINNAGALGATSGITFGGSTIDNTSGTALTYLNTPQVSITANTSFFNATATALNSMTFGGNVAIDTRTITLNSDGSNSHPVLTFNGALTGSGNDRIITVNGVGNTLVINGASINSTGNNTKKTTFSGTGNVTITGAIVDGGVTFGGSLAYTGSGVLLLSGANDFDGTTTVDSGKVVINGSVTSGTVVNANGTLGGSGTVTTIVGAGKVSTGNSAGILTATSINATTGMDFDVELTLAGAPTWANASASGNDLLRLTSGTTPFVGGNMTAANVFNLYFAQGGTYQGGIYTDLNTDFSAAVANATYNFFVLDASGAFVFNGLNYSQVTGGTTSVVLAGSSFANDVDGGYIMQFTAPNVPEANSIALLIGAVGGFLCFRRRRVG